MKTSGVPCPRLSWACAFNRVGQRAYPDNDPLPDSHHKPYSCVHARRTQRAWLHGCVASLAQSRLRREAYESGP